MPSATRSRRRIGSQPRGAGTGRRGGPPGPAPTLTGSQGSQAPHGSHGSHGSQPEPAYSAPISPRLRTRTLSIAGVRVRTLALIEVALALALVGWAIHPAAAIGAGVVGILLIVFALGRRRRIPLPEWISTIRAMKRRHRSAEAVPASADVAFAPLVEADPALRTYEYTDREQRPVGYVGDGTFLTALVRIEVRDDPLRPAPGARPLPLDLLRDSLDVDEIRLESAQFVQYTQPAPAPHLPEQAVAARSYATLQARTKTPAAQLTWVALKLDPELCPEAIEARGGGIQGAQRALLRVADQLASRLNSRGFRAGVLDEREVVSALSTAVCVNPRATNAPGRDGRTARRTRETARAWRCDDRRHTSYWISRWPQLGSGQGAAPLGALVQLAGGTRAMATSFALTLSRGGEHSVGMSGYVRLSCRSDNELKQAERELEQKLNSVKMGLVRLDREQLPGLLATLPLGGTR